MSHKPDDPMTQRADNASSLLNACQKLVNADVNQRQRQIEQLRIEKELFPKCIQAPVKYENKRKSSFGYSKNKENYRLTTFPGEQVSPPKDNRMENSARHVEQWLNKNQKGLTRKPFTDLSVNTPLRNNSTSILNQKNQQNSYIKTNRKRRHSKTKLSNENNLQQNKFNSKQPRKDTNVKKQLQNVQDNDESGICMEHDLIVIDDTQESHTDKDRKAWLAVLEANEHESTSFSNLDSTSQIPHYNNKARINNTTSKVPFYKKSAIVDLCKQCNELHMQSKDVSITVNSKDFFTTIKITSNAGRERTTNSVLVQTDISETVQMNAGKLNRQMLEFNNPKNGISNINGNDTVSEDLFKDEVRNIGVEMKPQNACVTIEESDSDMEASGPVSVTVDVHRSCDQLDYGVLSEIVDAQQNHRVQKAPRGNSPTSTNSSEKENFDPNRRKKSNSTKKSCKKVICSIKSNKSS